VKDLEEVTSSEYIWAVCRNPAYFVQYQVKSAALIKVRNVVLIVWKPKYIEYPSMVKFPELKDKKRKLEINTANNMKVTFLEGTTTN
jgi:hypothetical protein